MTLLLARIFNLHVTFFGGNKKRKSIPMTSPVSEVKIKGSEKIPMAAPVTQETVKSERIPMAAPVTEETVMV